MSFGGLRRAYFTSNFFQYSLKKMNLSIDGSEEGIHVVGACVHPIFVFPRRQKDN